jgi:excinuclease ABC subunit C
MTSNLIKELLNQLPKSPGVYLMRNARGNILYVGKAINLHNRVRSYFSTPAKLTPKTRLMVNQVNDFEYFVVPSEQEALILELNLIKRYWPPFNVLLKDDKTFPYLKIKFNEEWPRLHITRRIDNDGSHYFGPYASISSLRQTLDILKRIFPLRSCTKPIEGKKNARPCLKYHLGYCLAPCAGKASRAEYDRILAQLIQFLEGKHRSVVCSIKQKMEKASESLDFERAARFRDQLQAVQNVVEAQSIAMKVKGEEDVIAFSADQDQACVQVFMIRHGKLIGRESFTLKGTKNEEPEQIMTSFIKQFYNASPYIPRILLLQHSIEEHETIQKWLSGKSKRNVCIEVPQRGKKKQLVDSVAENARQGLEQLKIKQLAIPATLTEALAEIQKELHLPGIPGQIEGYDISNIQGTDAVGSMAVFEDGKPQTSHYRRFKIKTVEGANDYAMLQEMLRRRFRRGISKENGNVSSTWAILPDLVLIDGGKGQLNAAREVMKEIGIDSVSLVSITKENEELFIPGQTQPIVLPRSSPGLKLMQRIRDEAHRFAINYFQKLHKKRTFTSVLDEVTGIGPIKKKSLIKKFGTVQGIRQATIEELMTLKGINRSLAQKIKDNV